MYDRVHKKGYECNANLLKLFSHLVCGIEYAHSMMLEKIVCLNFTVNVGIKNFCEI